MKTLNGIMERMNRTGWSENRREMELGKRDGEEKEGKGDTVNLSIKHKSKNPDK